MGKSFVPQTYMKRKRAGGDVSPATIRCGPSPDGRQGQGRQTEVSNHSAATTFDVEEREGQGLCVRLDGTWRQAIWHHELVASLDKDVYGVHLYDFEPPRRNDSQPPEDITTFLPRQKSWSFDRRQDRPDILSQLYPTSDQFPHKFEAVPWLEIEVHGTVKIVLDVFSQEPLRDFKNIPLQLATNVEGGRLEAMAREDSRIHSEDFLQRMIPLLDENGKPRRTEGGTIQSERPVRNALNSVKTLFRNKGRCLSWNTCNHNSEFDKRLLNELTKQDIENNTTRNLADLSTGQITAVRSLAKGRRGKAKESNGDGCNEAPTKGGLAVVSTDNAEKPFAIQEQGGEKGTCPVEDHILQVSSPVTLKNVSTRVTQAGSLAKRQQNRKTARKYQHINDGPPSQPPAEPSKLIAEDLPQNGTEVIHPTTVTPATPATATPAPTTPAQSADEVGSSTPQESISQSSDIHHIDPALMETAEATEDQSPEKQLTGKHKIADEVNPDIDSGQMSNRSEREVVSLIPSPKRRKIFPPTYNSQVLSNFSASHRTGAPAQGPGNLHNLAPYADVVAQSVPPRSESQQLGAPPAARPITQSNASLNRPRPYLPGAPSPLEQYYPAENFRAEQNRFTYVSIQIASLETYRTGLVKAWEESQVDTTTGGGFYGPRFNISLSQLGEHSSVRSDGAMRSLMLAYHIPAHWSASSIDLRQHPNLRQAVHVALCEAERFDSRNYRNDFPGLLDIRTEGGFFLARAQPSAVAHTDSRFANFASAAQLNASLHSALWRYKQLTGRDFAPPGVSAFLAMGCSYHDAWCEIRRQIFLPYFLRFADPVEAVAWMPVLGMLTPWEGGSEKWEKSESHTQDGFGCRYDMNGDYAVDPRGFVKEWGRTTKAFLPLASVDLGGS